MPYYIPTVRKSGGARPPCPPPNCAHACQYMKTSMAAVLSWVCEKGLLGLRIFLIIQKTIRQMVKGVQKMIFPSGRGAGFEMN